MSLPPPLLGAAERYMDLGIPIVPVGDPDTPGRPGKKALMAWKKRPEPGHVLDVLAGDPRCTGIAAILGPKSDLICRDWDDADSYDAWLRENRKLTRKIPMVRSARAGHAYTIASGVKTRDLGDGEIRGAGAYVLVPPSLTVDPAPGAPRQYEWITKLPRSLDLIPRIDPAILIGPRAILSVCSPTTMDSWDWPPSGPQGSPKTPKSLVVPALGEFECDIEGEISVSECIRRSLPDGPGKRHHCLFTLARWLRRALPPDTSDQELCQIAAEWFEIARQVIRTQDLRLCQRELLDAWKRVEVPAGIAWDAIVQAGRADTWNPRLGSETADRIARLFRATASTHGGEPFPLDERRIAEAVGVKRKSVRDAFKRVVSAGVVQIDKRGVPGRNSRIATVWRWTGP